MFAVLLFIGAEISLRVTGVNPWRPHDISNSVYPGGKLYKKHSTLGYSHLPGEFTVTLHTGYSFKVTHLPSTLRITHPVDENTSLLQKEEIWIFGCSFTHGWSLNDHETYPWLLQERYPEYEIVNFGVTGYGTIHSLLQFKNALKTRIPRIVILSYAALHDERNTFSRTRRKNVASWNKLGPLTQPYALIGKNEKLEFFSTEVVYTEFPLMRHSAFVHFVEAQCNRIQFRVYRSHTVSELLIMEMKKMADKHGVKFILAKIDGNETILDFARIN